MQLPPAEPVQLPDNGACRWIRLTRATWRSRLPFRSPSTRVLWSNWVKKSFRAGCTSRTNDRGPDMWRNDASTARTKLILRLVAATFIVVTVLMVEAKAQSDLENQTEITTPLEPSRPGVTESQLFAEIDAHNEIRKSALHDYTARRTYQVVDLKGKVHAEEIGRMEFHAPDKKTFVVTSESGSGIVRRMALNQLISSEVEAAAGKEHHDSAISPENYSLDLLGEQQVGPHRCFVAQAVPHRK